VGRYSDAMARLASEPVEDIHSRDPQNERDGQQEPEAATPSPRSRSLVALPTVADLPDSLAKLDALRSIAERVAPLAVVDRSLRLAVAGCRPGDGVTTVAAALALDLSQRLSLKTIIVDAHIRRPALHRIFALRRERASELLLEGTLQIRGSGWPRLDIATCYLGDDERQCSEVINDFENLFSDYQAVILDLGVPRLDARMLPLARSTDPVLLVVRYGVTRRQELSTTAVALRAANRSTAGVILNGSSAPNFNLLRSLTKS
jgi:Mrp family chromosome partitioning ATPase